MPEIIVMQIFHSAEMDSKVEFAWADVGMTMYRGRWQVVMMVNEALYSCSHHNSDVKLNRLLTQVISSMTGALSHVQNEAHHSVFDWTSIGGCLVVSAHVKCSSNLLLMPNMFTLTILVLLCAQVSRLKQLILHLPKTSLTTESSTRVPCQRSCICNELFRIFLSYFRFTHFCFRLKIGWSWASFAFMFCNSEVLRHVFSPCRCHKVCDRGEFVMTVKKCEGTA